MLLWILAGVSVSVLLVPGLIRAGRGLADLLPPQREFNVRLATQRRPSRRTRAALRAATRMLS